MSGSAGAGTAGCQHPPGSARPAAGSAGVVRKGLDGGRLRPRGSHGPCYECPLGRGRGSVPVADPVQASRRGVVRLRTLLCWEVGGRVALEGTKRPRGRLPGCRAVPRAPRWPLSLDSARVPSRASRPLCPVPPQYVGAPVAYIQQIFVKSSVSPWHRDLLAVDVFRSPLSRAFQLVEEIRNHVLRDRYPWGPRLPAPVCPGGRCRPPAAR